MMGNYFRYWRKLKDISQVDIAKSASISQAHLSDIETGKANPTQKIIEAIAVSLNVSISQLLDGPDALHFTDTRHLGEALGHKPKFLNDYKEGDTLTGAGTFAGKYNPADSIPVLANIPAGPWREWIDDYPVGEGIERVPRYDLKGACIFAIYVDGDSMEPILYNGDLLILNPELAFSPNARGRIGVVKYDSCFKIRKVHLMPDGNNYFLEPLNKNYESEIVPVTGTVIFKIVDMRKKLGDEF